MVGSEVSEIDLKSAIMIVVNEATMIAAGVPHK